MISCVIVDDEPWALELLISYVSKVPQFELLLATSNPIEALHFINSNPVDLLFLDIQMPEMTGFQLIPLANKRMPIIITSAFSEYALQGYHFNVIDYLVKPIELPRFLLATQKAQELITVYQSRELLNRKEAVKPFIFIKTDGKLCKVNVDEILFVEAKRDYILLHLLTENLLTLDSLNNMELQLSEYGFIRIHKSYLIQINKINFVEGNRVLIHNTYLPIGDTYKKKFLTIISS